MSYSEAYVNAKGGDKQQDWDAVNAWLRREAVHPDDALMMSALAALARIQVRDLGAALVLEQ